MSVQIHEEAASATYVQLVEQAQHAQTADENSAFASLVERFRFSAQSWAFQILGDAHAAQDAAQEAFITAYQHLDELRDATAFPSWLRQLVRTHCYRQLRQQREAVPLDDRAPASDDPAALAEQRLLHDRLYHAIQALPEHERIVTELFYLKEYSQQEVAELLQLPLTTIKKRLQYAREHLRETMPAMALRLWCAA